ncbi:MULTISPECIES: acyltransferase family protein [unclassified Frankia]
MVVSILLGYRYGHLQGFIDTLTLPAFAIIIFLAGTREADGRRIPVFSSRPLVYFGEISYAFYLVHPAALTISGELGWVDATTAAGTALAILADFALSFALAAVLHHTVEGPARRWLMGVLRSRSSPRHAYRSLLPDVPPRIPQESASAVPAARDLA